MATFKQGDFLELEIIDYGSNGEGIAKKDGCVFFVPFCAVGETIKAKIDYVKKSFILASVQKVLIPAACRVEPSCNRFTRCGGCDIMHLSPKEQLQLKKKAVENTFKKNYGEVVVDEVVPSDSMLGYRNKLVLPFGTTNGKLSVGFYQENTHKVVSITKCCLHGEWAEKLISIFLSYGTENGLTAFDPSTQKGTLKHLIARKVQDFVSITVVAARPLISLRTLCNDLQKAFPNNFALYYNQNNSCNNVVLCGDVKLIGGKERAVDVRSLSVMLNPLSFLQVNDNVRDKIYDKVEEVLAAQVGNVIIDAYAGIGILGADLAKKGARVYNLEIVPEATADADVLAENNGLSHRITNICCDCAEKLPTLINDLRSDLSLCACSTMHLEHLYFDSIKRGIKTVEVRLLDEKRKQYKEGDTVCFIDNQTGEQMLCEIQKLEKFESFEDLFLKMGIFTSLRYQSFDYFIPTEEVFTSSKTKYDLLGDPIEDESNKYGAVSLAMACEVMHKFYSVADEQSMGVIGIKIRPISPTYSVILDPPRKGCAPAVLTALSALPLDNLIYISCNPATLSRDLKSLSTDYSITSITPYDMFPNTKHVETLVVLSHKIPDSHIAVKVDFDD